MFEVLQSISGELLTGLMGITGVLLGHKISSTSNYKNEQMKMLSTIYADVFANYMEFSMSYPHGNYRNFLLSLEKALLFCSKESEVIITEIMDELFKDNFDFNKCSDLVWKLQKFAKKEIKGI